MRVINHPAPVQTFIDQDGKAVKTRRYLKLLREADRG